MNYQSVLSNAVQQINPSGIRKFFDIMAEMDDVISLGVGEPDFVTPWHIRDNGIYSLEKGFTKYTSNAGMKELRRELSLYMKRRFDLTYEPMKEILITVGGSEAIDLTIRALVNPGEEVIIPVPSFVCYGPIVTLCGGVPVFLETKAENEFRITAEELKAVITDKTKLLILPFPNNPTGAVMEKHHLEEIAEVIKDTNIMVLSDEIYSELTYGSTHCSPANIPELYPRTIVVNGFSKSYAMTGWRLGYACGPAPIMEQMTKIHQFAIMCAPTASQYAAIEAVRNGDADIDEMREDYNRRRRFVLEGLRDLGMETFEPKGAFYIFPSIKKWGLSSDEFCETLLSKQKVAVISGSAFGPGGEGFVRICYASSLANLQEALDRIRVFVESLPVKD
ncbi:MAG: aminotransferase class I/II-fold pyridoxal phosphate-dependent enzyme [Clostridiales bacterium]|nr:aminotransferase class I/II-fold pyridoxal phosphate-dependent enzyme [Clostridiales bacterium]